MESWEQRSSESYRRVGAIAPRRRRRPSASCGRCATSSPRVTGLSRVANQLGYGLESVRAWVRQADVDDGLVGGTTTAEKRRIAELEQEVRELRRANSILKSASAFMLTARLCRLPARAMAFNLFGAGGR